VPVAARLWSLERAVQTALVATILSAVLASGSLQSWIPTARRLRWAALLALAALALVWALRNRARLTFVRPALAAGVFLGLALFSAAWSVSPTLSIGRTAALGLVFAAAGALAAAASVQPEAAQRVLDGVAAGAALVALGGLLVLLFRHDRAIAPATTSLPARYQGLGGGPNTATMLLAVALPTAAQVATGPGSWARRAFGFAAAVGALVSIVASGSRGALLGAFAGTLAWAALRELPGRRAVVAAFAVVAVFAAALAATRIPRPAPAGAPSAPVAADPAPAPTVAVPPYVDANLVLRLQDDVGHPPPGIAATDDEGRPLTSSSGRTEAWRGAVRQAADRPLLGYGFGTEPEVFVDRYVGFNAGVPENSYVGLALQLGALGLAAFAALCAALLVPALRVVRLLDPARRGITAAAVGVLVGGLALAFFQSYVYAAGNNATAALWICAFLLPAIVHGARRRV
jgi:hypothetical protein